MLPKSCSWQLDSPIEVYIRQYSDKGGRSAEAPMPVGHVTSADPRRGPGETVGPAHVMTQYSLTLPDGLLL